MERSDLRDSSGRPTWALKGLVSFLASAAARLTPDAVVVGFDAPGESVRKGEYPAYKAGRRDKSPDLVAQLHDAPGLLTEAGLTVVVPEGYEADDVLATAAAVARAHGWRCTVVTSDRDSFALVDSTTSVLRVLNGGIEGSPVLTPQRIPAVCGVAAGQYGDYAALRGDTSDNLPGARGIGEKTAARLLSVFATLSDAYLALDTGREAEVVAAIGRAATARLSAAQARADVARNQQLMSMRDDLPMPTLASMSVPIDVQRVHAALSSRDIRLGPSLWALTGATPPAQDRYAWYADQYASRPAPPPEPPLAYLDEPHPDGPHPDDVDADEPDAADADGDHAAVVARAPTQLTLFTL